MIAAMSGAATIPEWPAAQRPEAAARADGREEIAFLVRLARALHVYGTPAHRLEEALTSVARRLGLVGQFFSTPTSVFAAFGPDGDQRMVLARVEPGDVHLEKLSRLDDLLERFVAGDLDLAAAQRELAEVVDAPSRYGPVLSTLAYALVSASAARFFGGGAADVVLAAVVGLTIGLAARAAARFQAANRLLEIFAATLASGVAGVVAAETGAVAPFVVTVSALIVLLPGLTLTVAMNELATRHLVSGSSRLAGAGLVFVTLAFGVALGGRGAELLAGAAPLAALPQALPWWTEGVALVLSALGLTVLFQARPRDLGWLLLAGAVALAGGREGTRLLGPELGAFLGAVLVGLGGNLFARLRSRPAAVVQLPGLMLLVPGSLGFRSLASLLDRQTLSGVQTAFSMLLVAVGVVTGLLVANALLPPRRPL